MTIQMQNRELTVHSRKLKKILFIGIIITLLGIMICSCESEEKYSCKVYDNPDCVKELFVNNTESFNNIAQILKDNELFDYLYSINSKCIYGPDIPKAKKYLTDTEYEDVCAFLYDYYPYTIMVRNGYLQIDFFCKNDDVTIFYVEKEGEKLEYFLSYVGQHDPVEQIAENWYFRVRESDVTR